MEVAGGGNGEVKIVFFFFCGRASEPRAELVPKPHLMNFDIEEMIESCNCCHNKNHIQMRENKLFLGAAATRILEHPIKCICMREISDGKCVIK